MTETKCRYDRDRGEYVTDDGETCDVPKRDHCTARKTCPQHLGWGELTCARCLGRVRMDIQQIVQHAALMLPEALTSGVGSEAANMAGPAADYRVFSARRNIAKRWIMDHIHQPARDWCDDEECTRRHFKTEKGKDRWHKRGIENAMADLLDDDDERHPYSVLTRWAMMLAEDYDLQVPKSLTIASAGTFIAGLLTKVAQDEEQDFPLMARELKKCRTHLEAVISNSQAQERGAPCPTCRDAEVLVRLVREYAHWCDDEECTQRFHLVTDEADIWVCPRNREHWWTAAGYAEELEKRQKVKRATPSACA